MKQIFLMILVLTSTSLFSQNWLNVNQFSGLGDNYTSSISKDQNNNLYFFGNFADSSYIDTSYVKSKGGNDIFVGKMNDSLKIVWLNSAGSKINDIVSGFGGIAVNESENCIYVTGTFQDTCEFETTTLISQGSYDIFLAKYSLAGNLIWAKNIGRGVGAQIPFSIAIDISGDVIIDGFFINSIDFDGGISLITSGGATTNNFIAKFNNNGVLYWARKISQSVSSSRIKQVSTDSTGYYFTGYYNGDFNFDLGSISSVGSTDMFIYKTDFDGNGIWIRKIFGAGQETGQGISTDGHGNVYVGGYFQSSPVTIDSTSTIVSSINYNTIGNNDILLLKYDSNGNLKWSNRFGSTASDIISCISVQDNLISISGSYNANISFGLYNLTNSGSSDAFLVSLDTLGIVHTALPISSTLAEGGLATLINNDNNLIVAGDFTSPTLTILTTPPTTFVNNNSPTKDVFIAKYGCPKVTASFVTDSVSCPAGSDGQATVNPGAMTAYTWSNFATTQTITGLTVGTYKVTITGQYGCKYIDSVTITNKMPLVTTVPNATNQINCAASNNGVGIVVANNGVAPITYLWDNGITNDTALNLTVGVHYVTTTDFCGFKKDSVQVTNILPAQISLSTENILLTCATDFGTVTVLIQDGVAPFVYTWNDGVFGATRNDLAPGWHYITVTDVCNIPYIDSVRVNNLPEVTSSMNNIQLASCLTSNNGQATVQAISGLPPYTYAWSGSSSTTSTATDLSVGWHYVTVTDFCKSHIDSVLIGNKPLLQIDITASTPTNCAAATNGTATVTLTDGGSPFTYSWTGGESSATAIALGAGWNFVTVSDACFTVKIDSVNIAIQAALVSSVALTAQASCPTSNNGAATATATAGIGPYTFVWSNGDLTALADTLPVGWSYVTITDGCGAKIDSINVTNMPLAQVSLSTENILLTCATDFGTVTVLTQNGVAPFVYTWNDGVFGATRNDLAPGWHYVTVTDVCNIPFIDSVRVNNLPEVTTSITNSGLASCSLGGDGTATVQASSGVPPYSYLWTSGATTASANNLLTGWQYVSVSDYCVTHVDSVLIGSNPPLIINITDSSNVSCVGGNNGSATVLATDGGLSYTYIWTSGETTATATQLLVGLNYVTVTDACGSSIDSVLITVNAPMSIAITSNSPTNCAGGNNGSATVTVTNGSSPITYLWSSNNLFTDTLSLNYIGTNLINDTVYVQVTDACTSLTASVYISSLPPLTTTMTSWPASCSNSTDGKARVDIANGAGPYSYIWSNSISTGWIATDLPPGMNYVTVTDACSSYIDSVSVGVKTPLSATITTTPTACATDNNGTATVTALDGGLPYTYVWSSSTSTTNTATDLPVGNHFVTVTDVCGSLVIPFTISSTPVVTASISKENVKCYGQLNGNIIVTAANGITPYTYVWGDTTLTDSIRINIGAGVYYVTINDQCGSYTDSVTINQPGALSLSTINTNTSFTGLTDGAIDVIMSGGVQPYYYNWSNLATSEDLTNIAEGNYYLTVTDENGCIIIDSISIVTDSWHIEIYKAFTPNGDGKNDVWNIKHISAFPDCSVTIFDEWGIKVFESTGYETPWDGKHKNGKILPSATYYYIIDLKDGSKVYTGSVALIK